MKKNEQHLTQFELAVRWNMSHRTLENWRGAGIGPAYLKLAGKVVYTTDAIIDFETVSLVKTSGQLPDNYQLPAHH